MMTHDAFCNAYAAGKIRVDVDPEAAAAYLSGQLLLPFVALPVLGAGVALALAGWIVTGLAVLAAGIIVPRLIKRSAPRFVLVQALQDENSYLDLMRSDVLRVTAIEER